MTLETKNKIVCTDRNGLWIQDLFVTDKERHAKQHDLVKKHNGNIYFFAAIPSAPTNSPLRKASPRRFSIAD